MGGPLPKTNWLVHNQVLIGSQQSSQNIDKLKKLGITHFVSLLGDMMTEDQVKFDYAKDLWYMWFPISDFGVREDDATLQTVAQIVKTVKEGKKIYIHCFGGHGRTGLIAIMVFIALYKVSWMEAKKAINLYHATR